MRPSDAGTTELPASPGARLKHEREAQGLTEQQAAESLTLDPTVVFALEANDFAVLGAPVFVKGHLRRYAAMLGLPEDEILGAYERSKQHMAEPSLVPRSRLEMLPERSRPKWPWVAGGAIAFLVAALLAAYVSEHGLPWVHRGDDVQTPSGTAGEQGGTANVAPVTATTGASPDAESASPGSVAAGAGSSAGLPATTTPSGASGAASGGAAATPAIAGTESGSAPVARAPGQVQLQLKFTSDSWVEVFDGSGRAVLYDLGKAGTERTLLATGPLSVTLGNATAVRLSINGRPVAAPRQPGQANSRFNVTADGTVR